MLSIRLQRVGRSNHPMYRVVVQDSRYTPSSGNIVVLLGSYNPHTKSLTIAKDKANFYLEHGAQPSNRVISLFKKDGIKLPKWAVVEKNPKKAIKHPEKLRKNNSTGISVKSESTEETEDLIPSETSEDKTEAESIENSEDASVDNEA